jgi:hypothetical protein
MMGLRRMVSMGKEVGRLLIDAVLAWYWIGWMENFLGKTVGVQAKGFGVLDGLG